MTKHLMIGFSLAAALLIPRYARSHEGHVQKVLGTIVMRHGNHLQVTSTDGKSAEITLNEKTRILRGKTRVQPDDIKAGERIVVTTIEKKGKGGKPALIATEIKLGAAATTKTTK